MQFAQKLIHIQHGPSPCIRGSIQGADILDYKDAVGASWDASFVQLSAGNLDAGIEFLAGDGFALYRESWRQRLHLVGTLLPGMIALGIPTNAGQETRWWGQTLSRTCIPIVRSTNELNLVTGANESITVLTMSEEDFLRMFARLTGLLPGDFPGKGQFLHAEPGVARQVVRFWNSVLAQSSVLDVGEWSLVDLLAPLLNAIELPVTTHHFMTPKSALLDRVLHLAEASGFRASVPEISFDLNVSRRTIEYAFQDIVGESPYAYFNLRRLNLCRQALTEANPVQTTVASIATSHGFFELGRFADFYRRYFGELPSMTLRRTRGLVAVGMGPVV